MVTFFLDGNPTEPDLIRTEVITSAIECGVDVPLAERLFDGALYGLESDCWMLEDLIPGLECVIERGFGT